MTDPLNIIFDDFGIWLLGSVVYIFHKSSAISWLWSADEYENFWFWAKVYRYLLTVLSHLKVAKSDQKMSSSLLKWSNHKHITSKSILIIYKFTVLGNEYPCNCKFSFKTNDLGWANYEFICQQNINGRLPIYRVVL